jgi:2-polyprenyl-3-methyl-5-hydroxy-6-metoxy-1,4-benzoquinol methylase
MKRFWAKLLLRPVAWLFTEIMEELPVGVWDSYLAHTEAKMGKTNHNPVERIYPDDQRVKPQTVAHHKERYRFASEVRMPKKGDRALDMACGTGYGSDMLRKAGYSVTGVDISQEAITYAKKHYPECEFFLRDITEFRKHQDGGHFELITMFEVIEHLTYKEGKIVLKAIEGALKEDGIFLMSTPRDINGNYNTFHKSEWPYETIKNILGSIFSNIEILGQDWDTAEISGEHVRDNDFYLAVCRK